MDSFCRSGQLNTDLFLFCFPSLCCCAIKHDLFSPVPMGMFSCLQFSSRHVIFSELNGHIQVHSCMTDQIQNLMGQVFTLCRSAARLNFFFFIWPKLKQSCVERKCRRCRTVLKCNTYMTDSFHCIICNMLLFYYEQPRRCEKTS